MSSIQIGEPYRIHFSVHNCLQSKFCSAQDDYYFLYLLSNKDIKDGDQDLISIYLGRICN